MQDERKEREEEFFDSLETQEREREGSAPQDVENIAPVDEENPDLDEEDIFHDAEDEIEEEDIFHDAEDEIEEEDIFHDALKTEEEEEPKRNLFLRVIIYLREKYLGLKSWLERVSGINVNQAATDAEKVINESDIPFGKLAMKITRSIIKVINWIDKRLESYINRKSAKVTGADETESLEISSDNDKRPATETEISSAKVVPEQTQIAEETKHTDVQKAPTRKP